MKEIFNRLMTSYYEFEERVVRLASVDGLIELIFMAFVVANVKRFTPLWVAVVIASVLAILNNLVYCKIKYGDYRWKKLAYNIVGIILGTL